MAEIPSFLLHQWLGISPEEHSPTHYRLLGLMELEPEAEVIAFVSGWRLKFIEAQMRGALSDMARQLRDRMRAAQRELLDPQMKSSYDAALKASHREWRVPPRAAKDDDIRHWLGVVSSHPSLSIDHLMIGIREDEADVQVLKSQFDQRLSMLRDLEKISTDDEQRRVSALLKGLGQAERRLAKQLANPLSRRESTSVKPRPEPSQSEEEVWPDISSTPLTLEIEGEPTELLRSKKARKSSSRPRKTVKQQIQRPNKISAAAKWSFIGGSVVVCLAISAFAFQQKPPVANRSQKEELETDQVANIPRTVSESVPQIVDPVAAQNDQDLPPQLPGEEKVSDVTEVAQAESPQNSEPDLSSGSTELASASPISSAEPPTTDPGFVPESFGSAADQPAIRSESTSKAPAGGVDEMLESAATLMAVGAKNWKDVTRTLKQASNLFPKDIRPDFYLGLMNSGVGSNDLKAADFHFKKALERSPNHVATLNNLALVEVKDHKIPAARNFFTLATKQGKRPLEVDQNVGRILDQVKFFDIKKDDLKQITALNTNSAAYRPKTGWLYMPLDQTERSLSEYKAFCRDGNLEDCSCNRCGGKATVMCRQCGGRKTVLALGSTSEMRNDGITRPNITTVVTPTSAMLTCPTCRGNGRLDCTDCKDGRDPSLHR